MYDPSVLIERMVHFPMPEENRPVTSETDYSEQTKIRLSKLEGLQAEGKNPYEIVRFDVTASSADIRGDFENYENKTVVYAGRMTSRSIMGKASFAYLQDRFGGLQIYARRDDLGDEAYAAFKKLDIGDILGVEGYVFKTKTGEISIHCSSVTLLTKCLHPLPEKYHGLTDTDIRYRQRYLDMIVNPEVRDTFVKRSAIMRELRAFFDGRGFLEVDTPILTPFEIGASARPFYTHHN
ncbi:MAG: lysine--tRNA ligase, partial [Synergistes sp.]|nr:lysine--tRNA ligase [Synergistes sp.]